MKIGAQLYTVRAFTQTPDGFEETVRKISAMGYGYVQISGQGAIPVSHMANVCEKNNIAAVITHTNPKRIKDETDAVIAEHKLLGASYVGIGAIPGEYRSNAESFIGDYLPAAEKIYNAGLKFMYHNHDFEFEKFGGKLLYDILAEGFANNLMGFTLDTYWVQAGGGDPAFWLEKLGGRVDVIHVKDMVMRGGERRMAEVLEGNLNWSAVFKACSAAGVKYAMVEQDDCYGADPFECLERSLQNISRFL